jgi:acetyl esterase/lipase
MTGEAKDLLKNATRDAAAEAKEDYAPKPYGQHGSYQGPGRLGDPKMTVGNDPRTNAKLLQLLNNLGMNGFGLPPALNKVNENSTLDDIAVLIKEFEDGIVGLYNNIPLSVPGDENEVKIDLKTETIKGGDGQDMKVYVYRPEGASGKLPAVIYTHGGGMVLIQTMNPIHDRWCKSLAAQGMVAIMPDFRNAYTKEKYNHFPAGLNDCVAAAKWVIANKDKLGIRNVVLEGESGGANLACATALKANREGWAKDISGVYALVPYISNAYGWPEERMLKELPSLVENHGYFLNSHANAFMGHFYTPTDEHHADPLAWPYHATADDMKGLPPHVVVMDELDPLRDEGISYARRLVQAGVDAKGSVNLGVIHGASLITRATIPEFNKDTIRNIAAFAKEL